MQSDSPKFLIGGHGRKEFEPFEAESFKIDFHKVEKRPSIKK